ncbi:MAG: hypothetical protein JWR19_2768, partial [Pedosphaera sp.]|nr:hypothetical protein [Pedosphaera sp.]
LPVSIASSADGSTLIAGSAYGPVYTSDDFGTTWISNSAPVDYWQSVACSADETKLASASSSGDGLIYISTNSGASWASANAPFAIWQSIVFSGDGSKLVGVAGGTIYSTTNFGTTWSASSVQTSYLQSVASSADGSKLVAVDSTGPIYTWQSIPQLSIACLGGEIVISWPNASSSIGYHLQQNSDFNATNWMNVAGTPGVTNGQCQTAISPTGGGQFYRLTSP